MPVLGRKFDFLDEYFTPGPNRVSTNFIDGWQFCCLILLVDNRQFWIVVDFFVFVTNAIKLICFYWNRHDVDIQVFVKTPLSVTQCLQLKQTTSVQDLKTSLEERLGVSATKMQLYSKNIKVCISLHMAIHFFLEQTAFLAGCFLLLLFFSSFQIESIWGLFVWKHTFALGDWASHLQDTNMSFWVWIFCVLGP